MLTIIKGCMIIFFTKSNKQFLNIVKYFLPDFPFCREIFCFAVSFLVCQSFYVLLWFIDYLVGHYYTGPKLEPAPKTPAPKTPSLIGVIFLMFTVKLS